MSIGAKYLDRRKTLIAGLSVAAAGAAAWSTSSTLGDHARIRVRPLTFEVNPFLSSFEIVDDRVVNTVCERLRWRPEMGYSDLLHWLRIFGGKGSNIYEPSQSQAAIRLLTDERRIHAQFGQAGVVVRTDSGVRFLSRLSRIELKAAARPTHPFQELAVFGELGLESSTPVFTATERFTLNEAIQDCLRNLQTREVRSQEPEWPTQALAHFLPPTRSWMNRWGERVTIDQWTSFLLERDMNRFSCGGTHLLHSLALLLQVDARYRLLSDKCVTQVRDKCRTLCREIESSQHVDGAWRADWSTDGLGKSYDWIDVHLTGHILEAQLYLPEDLRISNRCADAAIRHLTHAFGVVNDEVVASNYCFFSHAGRVLLHSCDQGPILSQHRAV